MMQFILNIKVMKVDIKNKPKHYDFLWVQIVLVIIWLFIESIDVNRCFCIWSL